MGSYDAIVLGLGAMGSSAVYQLAGRGARVLGIDQFAPPHSWGSTHGQSRVTRLALGEGGHYVALARRSHKIWRDVEAASGEDLLTTTGCLVLGLVGAGAALHGVTDFVGGTVRVAKDHGVDHELLDHAAIQARFPQFQLGDREHAACYEPGGGFIRPERAVATQLDQARRLGATLLFDERVDRWSVTGSSVVVQHPSGTDVAAALIVTAGPWMADVLGLAGAPLTVSRQVIYWFRPSPTVAGTFSPERCPVFIWTQGPSVADMVYGIPALGPDGVKVGTEDRSGAGVRADDVDREVTAGERQQIYQRLVRPRLPGLEAGCSRAEVCLYTETPDRGFLIDRHPEWPQVFFASACSGHGFKHSPAIGEALAQMALGAAVDIDLAPFSLARFGAAG